MLTMSGTRFLVGDHDFTTCSIISLGIFRLDIPEVSVVADTLKKNMWD